MKPELAIENVSKLNPICFEVSLWSQKKLSAGYEERCMGSFRKCWEKGKEKRPPSAPLVCFYDVTSLLTTSRNDSLQSSEQYLKGEQKELVFSLNTTQLGSGIVPFSHLFTVSMEREMCPMSGKTGSARVVGPCSCLFVAGCKLEKNI